MECLFFFVDNPCSARALTQDPRGLCPSTLMLAFTQMRGENEKNNIFLNMRDIEETNIFNKIKGQK